MQTKPIGKVGIKGGNDEKYNCWFSTSRKIKRIKIYIRKIFSRRSRCRGIKAGCKRTAGRTLELPEKLRNPIDSFE